MSHSSKSHANSLGARQLATVFSNGPTTIEFGVDFTRTFAAAGIVMMVFFVLTAGLRSAGNTLTPFYAGRVTAESTPVRDSPPSRPLTAYEGREQAGPPRSKRWSDSGGRCHVAHDR